MSTNATAGLFKQILLSREIVTPEELEEAQSYASEQETTLAKALTDLDVLTEDDVAALFADAYQVRSLKLEDVEIDRESVRHIPAAVAHKHKLVPVRRSGNTLVIAMADPCDHEARAAVRAVTDFEVVVFVAKMEGIEHALHIHYGEPPEDSSEAIHSNEAESKEGTSIVPDERYAHIGRSSPLNRRYGISYERLRSLQSGRPGL